MHYIGKFYIIDTSYFVYPIYYTLVFVRFCSHVVLWIILTYAGGLFSYVGKAYGSTRHCRHCTLGCIAYSLLLCRFSLFRPLSRVPGAQSRRPSSLNGPTPFRRLQQMYFTEKERRGVWGMMRVHWTIWHGWLMCSCCGGCGIWLPPFSVSPIYTLCLISLMMSSYPFEMIGSWPHLAMVVVLVCPHFPHLQYIGCLLIISLMMLSYSTFYDDVLYILLLYRFALNIFPVKNGGSRWNFWGLAIGERVNSNWRR